MLQAQLRVGPLPHGFSSDNMHGSRLGSIQAPVGHTGAVHGPPSSRKPLTDIPRGFSSPASVLSALRRPCCPLRCFPSTSREGASTGSGGTRVLRTLETCKGQSMGGREQHQKYSRCPGMSPLPTRPCASLDSQLHRAKAYQAEAPRRDRDRHSTRPHLRSRLYERRKTHWEAETQVLPEGEQPGKDTLSSLPLSPPRPLHCRWWETRPPQCPKVAATPLHLCRHPP